MRVALPALSSLLLLLLPTSAHKESPELLADISHLQTSLTRLNRLLQQADLNPDDEIMTHAATIVQRVRNLVAAADENSEMIKHDRVAKRVAARRQEIRALRGAGGGIGDGMAVVAVESEQDVAEAERERHLDLERSLFDTTISFPECQEQILENCLSILDSELQELGMAANERIIHEKRNLAQEGYNKVVIITDLSANAVKGKNGDGKVHYEFPWDDATEGQARILNDNGVWDCHALTPDQCCNLVRASAPNPDKKGNYLECHIFIPYGGVGNPKTNDRVFINLSPDGRVQEAPFIA